MYNIATKVFKFSKPKSYIPPSINGFTVHLDFGCGTMPRNPFRCEKLITLDIFKYSSNIPEFVIEPGERIPLDNNSVSSVSAYDVIEHLSRDSFGRNLFIYYMNEIFRVLVPGGYALFIFPDYPGRDAFSDPTHVNYLTSSSVNYFVGNSCPPYYAGIETNFEKILNNKLRFWRPWVNDNNEADLPYSLTFRRKLSLLKRSVLRFSFPQHRIWLLRRM